MVGAVCNQHNIQQTYPQVHKINCYLHKFQMSTKSFCCTPGLLAKNQPLHSA